MISPVLFNRVLFFQVACAPRHNADSAYSVILKSLKQTQLIFFLHALQRAQHLELAHQRLGELGAV